MMAKRAGKQSSDRPFKPVNRSSLDVRVQVPTRLHYAWCVGLAVVTLGVYFPAIFHPFVNYDDIDYVTQNPHVQAGPRWDTITWAFTSTEAANWHPLTWLSHALDWQIYGQNAHGHHLTSILLHVANAALLFVILQWATGATQRSAVMAALFALHPLNVESVAWVAERKDVLSMFFFLLALAAYGRYARQPSWARYVVVTIAFAMGLAAKPMLVTLPFVLLLLDYWPLRRIEGWIKPLASGLAVQRASWQRLLLEKVPLVVLSAACSAVTMAAQSDYGTVRTLDASLRLANALYSYGRYVLEFSWPVHLTVLYPHPLGHLMPASVAAAALFLFVITVLVWRWRRQHPYAIVGWLWFLGTLIPVIGIVQVGDQGMADRYMYIPMIGILVAVVWGCGDFSNWMASRSESTDRWISAGSRIIAGVVLFVLAILSVHQIGFWSDSFHLWSHALEVTERNFVANDRMASLLMGQGRINEANHYFEAAAQAAPWDPISHLALGAAAQDRGDLQEAARDFEVALGAKNSNFLAYAYANLSIVHRLLGDNVHARQEAQSAMTEDAGAVRGMIRQQAGLVQANPVPASYLRLGLLFEVAGQNEDAKAAFNRALQLDANFIPARQALQTENAMQ